METTSGHSLFTARGRSNKKDKGKKKSRSKSRNSKKFVIKCYKCHEEGHVVKNCLNREDGAAERRDGEAAVVQEVVDGYESSNGGDNKNIGASMFLLSPPLISKNVGS